MIAIIDDSLVMSLELKKLFSTSFPKEPIESYSSVEDFLKARDELSDDESYSFISIDYNLPGKNGIELCDILRQGGETCPLLLLTANSQTVLEDRCRELSATFMRKPIDRGDDYQRFIDELSDFIIAVED